MNEAETEQAWSYDDLRTICAFLSDLLFYVFIESEGYGAIGKSRGNLSCADHRPIHHWTPLDPAVLEAETHNR